MVALDLDGSVLDGSARAAVLLQVLRDGVELTRRQPADDADRLAAAAALAAEDANDAVPWELRRGCALTPLALVAVAGRVDEPAVAHEATAGSEGRREYMTTSARRPRTTNAERSVPSR